MKRVIAYASRALGKAERNYPAQKLKFLALKWAVTEIFKDYLYGSKFTVFTNNNPLTYVLSKAKLDATGHRWLAALAAFDFSIKYKPGVCNADADILSRLPHSPEAPSEEELSSEAVHTICGTVRCPVAETNCLSAAAIDILVESQGQDIASFTSRDWRRAQNEDEVLRPWMSLVRNNKRPRRQDFPCTPSNSVMYKNFDSFRIQHGALYRETKVDGEVQTQLVLLSLFVQRALKGFHSDIGHPGSRPDPSVGSRALLVAWYGS